MSSVWEDLGFSPEEDVVLHLRARLMSDIREHIHQNEWTQSVAAKRCGVSQPRINDLLRGKFHKFSLDALVTMAACLGNKVTIQMNAA
jgi:predicted XRE-type DNA-binding protein